MQILEDIDLRGYSTMRLGGHTRWLGEAHSQEDIKQLVHWAKQKTLPFLIIGQGSNIVWQDDGFQGLIIVNRLKGIEVLADDEKTTTARFGAGEIWDEAVAWSVNRGLSGIEFLSKIPGLAGAAPVQNIGAYGTELADVLTEVALYDTLNDSFETMLAGSCQFAYRTSRFKTTDKGRFAILGITLKLQKTNPEPPFYESLQKYLTEHGVTKYTPKTIREAVIEIRKVRLPDPSIVNNNGSFFTNPFVDEAKFKQLQAKYPDIKGWPTGSGKIKLAAGWLVEQAGFKETHDTETGMATWSGNALVLVNEHAEKTESLLVFKQKIIDKVKDMFGVGLEQEPELLP